MLKVIKFLKDALLRVPVTMVFAPIGRYMVFIYYYNRLIRFIYSTKGALKFHDFYSPVRDYDKRLKMFEFLLKEYQLDHSTINYLEFGVSSGASFKWWLSKNTNTQSRFVGFDTFEGLPEDWGTYDRGAMSANIPQINDSRGRFIKGLFQDTLVNFIQEEQIWLSSSVRKVIHMDADLYSATAFSLSQLYPYLKKGDIILFDEFSVAMHEFKAYDEFVNNFYIKLTPIASVNNFYQIAFIID